MCDNRLVCQCAHVTAQNVKDFIKIYPESPASTVKLALNIGRSCGACQELDHPHIDIAFYDLMKELRI